MPVSTFTQPNYTSDLGTSYPTNIDSCVNVLAQMGQDGAPHAASSPNLTVLIDALKIIKADGTLVSQNQQTATFVAPVTNPRIDRIVIDTLTGAYSIIAGTEAASPTAPAITAGKFPCAQVSLVVGQTQITNVNITDERTALVSFAGFTTGDVKLTLKTVADTGWIMANDGTIGSAASSATTRAHADTEALYILLWTNIVDAYAPVTGGRGASAAADFAANKPLALTKMLGRALAIAGSGAGLTTRALGSTTGAETHTLTPAETPLKNHAHTASQAAHSHVMTHWSDPGQAENTGTVPSSTNGTGSAYNVGTDAVAPSITVNATSDTTASAHNNMQPTSFLNAMIKL